MTRIDAMNRPDSLRPVLLDLHKAVLDAVRRDYERDRGVMRDADFLNALIDEPALGWLKPMTSLVAELDQALDDEDLLQKEVVKSRLRSLIAAGPGMDGFQRPYFDLLERNPDALVAHVRSMRALQS
jgi:hypothetical protein